MFQFTNKVAKKTPRFSLWLTCGCHLVVSDIVDEVFAASSRIEYNTAIIAKAESDIQSYETELLRLKEIGSSHTSAGETALSGLSLGLVGNTATSERAKWLLAKMHKALGKVSRLEKENEASLGLLAGGKH